MTPRWTSACQGCGREREVQTRLDHAAKVLCDECAAQPHRPPTASGMDAADTAAKVEGASAPVLRFVTTRELHEHAPTDVPWVWDGYIARGAVTLVAGRPKAGKTTLVAAVVQAVSEDAAGLLGRAVVGSRVLVLSEEGHSTLKDKLPPGDRVLVANRETTWPLPAWGKAVEQATAEAQRFGAGLLVIDTFTFWAQLADGGGNDADVVAGAMRPLTVAARSGLAVVLVHHQGKGGGEDGRAVLGNTQFTAAVDVVVEVERVDDKAQPFQRQVLAVGRFGRTPGALIFDRDPASGALGLVGEAGSREEVRAMGRRGALLDALPEGEPGVTLGELEAELGDKREWKRALDGLVASGEVRQGGRGVKGDPKVFWRTQDSVPDSLARNRHGKHGMAGGGADGFWGVPVGNPRIIAPGASDSDSVAATESGGDPDPELAGPFEWWTS